MSYESQLQKFQALGMNAIDRLVQDNSELFLSISEEDAAQKIVALTRLRANELPEPQNETEMYNILADLLGELLRDDKIKILPHGLSTLGHNQRLALVARVVPVEVVQAEDPRLTYSDIVEIFNGPAHILNSNMKNESFRVRYNEAVAAGAI